MLDRFIQYIEQEKLFNKDKSILIAVSGGIDSVVLLDLFVKAGYITGIAHCNFKLRGKESDEDEKHVKKLAEKLNIPFFSTKFETKQYAGEKNISIQMAARDQRYKWFEEIREVNGYDYIATAHNKNDITETFFINFTRGTGIRGLTGIKPKMNNIVRPLLFAARKEITNYCKKNKLKYREDSSNSKIRYKRNLIRHKIIPFFEKLNPAFLDTSVENINRLASVEKIYHSEICALREKLLQYKNNEIRIRIKTLNSLQTNEYMLFDILMEYNFNFEVIKELMNSYKSRSGIYFLSDSHRIIKDRDYFIITELADRVLMDYNIENINNTKNLPLKLKFEMFPKEKNFFLSNENYIAFLDSDLIKFPLTLRKWQKGDFFFPLGMNKRKKISDFFIDNKLSIPEKENVWLLTSDNKVCWIIDHRIDNRFKITENTKGILKIEYVK